MPRARLRDLARGRNPATRPLNAITDVAGVKVGYATVIEDRPRSPAQGSTADLPARTGDLDRLRLRGDVLIQWQWRNDWPSVARGTGLAGAPIGITNTYQVGIVRDAITAMAVRDGASQAFHLPVVAETYDGWLSDIQGFTLTQEHAFPAFNSAVGGCAIAKGNVGGGTGMICHEFKGGTGTASRIVVENGERYTVGALVQANYGARDLLRVDGVPVGREIGPDVVPAHRSARGQARHRRRKAPSSSFWRPTRLSFDPVPAACPPCHELASRGWAASVQMEAATSSSRSPRQSYRPERQDQHVEMLAPDAMTSLFQAAAEATEEAILNAMCMASCPAETPAPSTPAARPPARGDAEVPARATA